MKQRDIAVLMEGIAPVIMGAIAKAVQPLAERLAKSEARVFELESRPAAPVDITAAVAALVTAEVEKVLGTWSRPVDGKSVTVDELKPLVVEVVAGAVDALPKAENGKDADPEVTRAMVKDAVAEAFAALPMPRDGKDVDVEAVAAMVNEQVAKAVAGLPDPPSIDPEAISASVAAALDAWPRPQDGKSVTVDDVAPLVAAEVAKAVAALPAPKDGVGLAGALKDHEGNLVLTLTNGAVAKLGRIDGEPGKDGADGMGFDDLEVVYDGGRGFVFRFAQGDRTKEFQFTMPVVIDKGVFKDGTEYEAADGVTFGGSYWIARSATKDKPGTSDAWRLAVKKGRDGKDGELKSPPGPTTVKL